MLHLEWFGLSFGNWFLLLPVEPVAGVPAAPTCQQRRCQLWSCWMKTTSCKASTAVVINDFYHIFIILPFPCSKLELSFVFQSVLLSSLPRFHHFDRVEVNKWISLCVLFVWLSAEKRRPAQHFLAVAAEPQTADGNVSGGGAAWRTGPVPLHHPVPQRSCHLQLWRAHRER